MTLKDYLKDSLWSAFYLGSFVYSYISEPEVLLWQDLLPPAVISAVLYPYSRCSVERFALRYTTREYWSTGMWIETPAKNGMYALYYLFCFLAAMPIVLIVTIHYVVRKERLMKIQRAERSTVKKINLRCSLPPYNPGSWRECQMKSYSYTTLLLATTGVLGCVFAFFIWRDDVNQTTFLAKQTLQALLVASLVLGLCLSGSIKKWGKGKRINGVTDNVKLVAGTVLIAYFINYAVLITLTWMIPGTMSTYTAAFEYSARTRNGCSGANVDDPDLKRRIKVCEPAGNYFNRGTLSVTKRTNALGMTVVHAATKY